MFLAEGRGGEPLWTKKTGPLSLWAIYNSGGPRTTSRVPPGNGTQRRQPPLGLTPASGGVSSAERWCWKPRLRLGEHLCGSSFAPITFPRKYGNIVSRAWHELPCGNQLFHASVGVESFSWSCPLRVHLSPVVLVGQQPGAAEATAPCAPPRGRAAGSRDPSRPVGMSSRGSPCSRRVSDGGPFGADLVRGAESCPGSRRQRAWDGAGQGLGETADGAGGATTLQDRHPSLRQKSPHLLCDTRSSHPSHCGLGGDSPAPALSPPRLQGRRRLWGQGLALPVVQVTRGVHQDSVRD